MRKRRGFHLWKNIKKAIGKVGTLNLVLILMFAFLFGLIGRCCAYSGSTQPYQKRMPVLLLQRQSEKPAFADGSARPRTGKGSMTGNVQTEKKITIQKWRK